MNEGDLVWWINSDELYILLYKGLAMARIYNIRTQITAQVFLSDIRKAQTDIF
jgi:hypothetical protein